MLRVPSLDWPSEFVGRKSAAHDSKHRAGWFHSSKKARESQDELATSALDANVTADAVGNARTRWTVFEQVVSRRRRGDTEASFHQHTRAFLARVPGLVAQTSLAAPTSSHLAKLSRLTQEGGGRSSGTDCKPALLAVQLGASQACSSQQLSEVSVPEGRPSPHNQPTYARLSTLSICPAQPSPTEPVRIHMRLFDCIPTFNATRSASPRLASPRPTVTSPDLVPRPSPIRVRSSAHLFASPSPSPPPAFILASYPQLEYASYPHPRRSQPSRPRTRSPSTTSSTSSGFSVIRCRPQPLIRNASLPPDRW
ncbi:hypothetical protein L1887_52914 [Cichorium endivia]|nr:hypothetical protein L1887_52914 [Cichorium endivia]